MSENTSLSNAAPKGMNRRERALLFSAFLLIGGLTFLLFFVRPLLKIIDARGWNETSCVIISSQVKTHDGSEDKTYSVDILYSYEINGKEYRSNRYQFMGGSSSGFSDKAAIVNRYPPGTETTCYVNSRNPRDAVIERGFTADLLFGLIPLLFMLIGAGGLFSLQRPELVKKFAEGVGFHQTTRQFMKPHPKVLVAVKPKLPHVLFTTGSIISLAFWYALLLDLSDIPSDLSGLIERIRTLLSDSPIFLIFLLLPLAHVPKIVKSLMIIILGDTLTFDGVHGSFLKGKQAIARFDEIEYLQIRPTIRKRVSVYKLVVVLKNGKEVQIDASKYVERICELADDIANIVNVQVVRTE